MSVGEIRWGNISGSGGQFVFEIRARPDVTTRIKRMFPRANQQRAGTVVLRETLDVCRDLSMLLTRYDLKMTDTCRARIEDLAAQHVERELVVRRVNDGQLQLEPPKLALPLRGYQSLAAELTVTTGRLLLTDELGLGKTASAIGVLMAEDALPALVVCLTNLPRQWTRQLAKFAPWLKVHTPKVARPYDIEEREPGWDVVILGYSKLAGWSDHLAGVVRTVVFDEMQELRRDSTAKYVGAQVVSAEANYRMGLTATPVYNYGGEMYNIMEVLAPDTLGSRDEFVREWGAGGYADSGNIVVNDPRGLGEWLRGEGLMIGRTRKEVGRELPAVLTDVIEVESDDNLLDDELGDSLALAEKLLSATEKGERFRVAGELDWRLRQATGIAKARYVADFVRILLESEQKIVLCGWHRAVYEMWATAFRGDNIRVPYIRTVMYTGSESENQKDAAVREFVDGGARVFIMSLRSGAGLDGLQEASKVIVFGELDWSPKMHEQNIGRLHRDPDDPNTDLAALEPVLAYYLVSNSGSDPFVMETLGVKQSQSVPMINPERIGVPVQAAPRDRLRMLAADVLRRAGRDVPVLVEDGDDEDG